MKSFRDIRVIPVVLVAIFGLAVLKIAGLVLDGGYVFDYDPQTDQEVMGAGKPQLPGRPQGGCLGRVRRAIPTSPVRCTKSPRRRRRNPRHPRPKRRSPTACWSIPIRPRAVSPSERAILERLQARRQELETRAREIDIRENLLKSAEKRIESRVEEMKATEARITTATGQKAEIEASRMKGIITMYEAHEAEGRRQGVRPAGNVRAVRNRLPDRPAQDVRHPRPDAAGSGRAADRRDGAPGRFGSSPPPAPICPRSRARCCRKSPINADI